MLGSNADVEEGTVSFEGRVLLGGGGMNDWVKMFCCD
jgi:hypothetical protein